MLAVDAGGAGGGGGINYSTGNGSISKLETLRESGSYPIKSIKDYIGEGHIVFFWGSKNFETTMNSQLDKISEKVEEIYNHMKDTASKMQEIQTAVHSYEKIN